MNQNKDKTHCIHGHPLKGDNLRIRKSGYRNCITCQNIINLKFRIIHGQPKDRYADIRQLFEASKSKKVASWT